MADKTKDSREKHRGHSVYDDATIEHMVHYYGIKDEESLLRFIKSRGLQPEE